MAAPAATPRNADRASALAEALACYRVRTPRSAARHAVARGSLPGGNTRTVLHYAPYPAAMARGEAQRHAGTFNNNVLSMMAGLVGLRQPFTPHGCVELNACGDRLRERLNRAAAAEFPLVVTGRGSILDLHFLCAAVRAAADAARGDATLAALFHLPMPRTALLRRSWVDAGLKERTSRRGATIRLVEG